METEYSLFNISQWICKTMGENQINFTFYNGYKPVLNTKNRWIQASSFLLCLYGSRLPARARPHTLQTLLN